MRQARSSRRWASATYAAACVAFAGTLGALAAQVRAGDDPALGAVATPAPPPRQKIVVTRRIIRTTVVTTRVVRRPKPQVVAAPTGYASTAPAPYVPAPAPTNTQAAPRVASPAPSAPAPAPAPAPAAPVTRGS